MSVPVPRTIRSAAPVLAFIFVAVLVIQVYRSPDYKLIPGYPMLTPFYFEPPEASVLHSVIRGDNVAWTMDNETAWHSVGRHPNQPECWTFEDRFGAYKNLSLEMAAAISNNNKKNRSKKAIILRLGGGNDANGKSAWKSQFIWHVRSLVMEAGYLAGYDVLIFVHLDLNEEDRNAWLQRLPKELQPLVQTFSTRQLKEWIRGGQFKNVYEHNHIPIQMFMEKNPQYDFVYSIENDVRLIGRWDTFLADVDTEYSFHRKYQKSDQNMSSIPDLVSFQSISQPPSDWVWYKEKEDQKCVKHFGGKDNILFSLGAVWGWSRQLTDSLTKLNTEGFNCYFEYFAPTVARWANLTSFFYQHPLYCPNRDSPSERHTINPDKLGKNDPRLVQSSKVPVGCTYYFINIHSQPFWDTWYQNPRACRPPALVHPVK
ncbi:hypothetical protein TWF694_007898 [Orbilia ellipsospora]|uniref:Uncharacterized protein n=1 Tax=Orbilia ellipsospora TaxID=2528407 RepID=A0AAV9XJJ0_9PEZI